MKSEKEKAKERAQIEMNCAQEIAERKRRFPPVLDGDFFRIVGKITPQVAKPLVKIKLEVYEDIEQERLFHVVLDGRRYKFVPEELEHLVETLKNTNDNDAKVERLRFPAIENFYTKRQMRFIADFLVSAWDCLPEPDELEKWEED